MTKVAFSKLGLKKKEDTKIVIINGQEITVKQYLPVNDKLGLISRVLNQAADDNNFSNPVKLDVFTNLEIVFSYTNISFTEKQKEDLVKLYDLMEANGVFDKVIAAIPSVEYQTILDGVQESSDAVYAYRNSVLGILESVSQDYANLDLDANKIQKELADPKNMELLKDVLTKLG